jgi:hypothetical protein
MPVCRRRRRRSHDRTATAHTCHMRRRCRRCSRRSATTGRPAALAAVTTSPKPRPQRRQQAPPPPYRQTKWLMTMMRRRRATRRRSDFCRCRWVGECPAVRVVGCIYSGFISRKVCMLGRHSAAASTRLGRVCLYTMGAAIAGQTHNSYCHCSKHTMQMVFCCRSGCVMCDDAPRRASVANAALPLNLKAPTPMVTSVHPLVSCQSCCRNVLARGVPPQQPLQV